MSTIDTTFLRASKEAIASPTDYPQSPLSQALRQPVLLGLFLPIHHGGWSSSNLPRTTDWSFDYNAKLTQKAEELGFDLVFGYSTWQPKGGQGPTRTEAGLDANGTASLAAYMVGISTLVAIVLGLPLGLLLVMTGPGNLLDFPQVHKVLGAIINTGRSFPFIILLVVLTPLTRLIVGTSIGSTAALVLLTLAAIPFFGRIAETSILEVDKGLIEAA